jgi:hypothetical protein
VPKPWNANSDANPVAYANSNTNSKRDVHANTNRDSCRYGVIAAIFTNLNTHGYSFVTTERYADSYCYGYIYDGADCYANSYVYRNYSSDSDRYSDSNSDGAADAQSTATCNAALAAHASTKVIKGKL